MIDSCNPIIPLAGGLAAECKSAHPVRQTRELERPEAESSTGAGPDAARSLEHIERELNSSPRRTPGSGQIPLRGLQAIHRYNALQVMDERDYLSRAMGVDEYI